jgi:hypothetical protein
MEVMSMKRMKDVVSMAVSCGLALSVLLAGCNQNKAPSAAIAQPAAGASVVASDTLPEVVISAPREGAKRIVVSDRRTQPETDR